MLRWAIIFFVFAIVAGAFGFFGLESTSASIARVLFFGFVIVAIVSLVTGRRRTI